MCYFLIKILKIAMSARRSVIIHQTSAFVILLAETAIFVGGDTRLVLFPGVGYPRYATDTNTLVYERCVII